MASNKWIAIGKWVGTLGALTAILGAGVSYPRWWPHFSDWVDTTLGHKSSSDHGDEAGGEHGHDHASHGDEHAASESTSLELTPQARNNLGLTSEYLKPIQLVTYRKTISVPAVVIAKPGRTQIQVSSPLNGVVTHVHAVTGESVTPGALMFEIRLSYEDLVESQTAFLKSLGELEVEKREIARLEEVTQSGAVSGKVLLERRYAKEKLEALIRSQREGLKLHGLSDRQVETIATEGKLLRELQIVAPDIDEHSDDEELRLSGVPATNVSYVTPSDHGTTPADLDTKPLIIEDLQVRKGQAVVAGEKLCALSDFAQLYIEGQAFEQDSYSIGRAAEKGLAVDAVFPEADGERTVEGLKLAFVGNLVDVSSRTLSFYVDLKNEILRDESNEKGQRYVSWKYRPGQRLQLRVPIDEWTEQIVLPLDAVVKEGADYFVFQQNGSHFDRVAVHVKYRDQSTVVIANDGSIFPGDVVAMRGAHQMQMALKNKSGAGADPHAGHSH